MNPFEKIFNYQIISRLDEAQSIALTTQERSWLKTMLTHDTAEQAFLPDTLRKLQELTREDEASDSRELIIEKARSRERQVYHPLLRTFRRIIMQDKGVVLTYRIKHGGVKTGQSGLPYKLEYSMVKREWYLLWYSTRQHALMSTKLQNVVSAEETILPAARVDALKTKIAALLEERKEHAVIEVIRTYNAELSRILYAFSCFDKSVDYDEASDVYRIMVVYQADDSEFLLSKIRFLGLRVKIAEGETLQRRMRESAAKALGRYGVDSV